MKTDGKAETLLLPPGYGGAEETGDPLVALLRQALQVTVDQSVLYVVISAVDDTAPTAELLGIREGITKSRGRWYNYDTGKREIRAMPTFHPAFLLRSPLQKRLAWRDFLAIKKALGPEKI